MAKRLSLSEQVRRAINSSGQSQYRICKETGVDKATLSRFMAGERGLSTSTLDLVVEYLGLELSERKFSPKGR